METDLQILFLFNLTDQDLEYIEDNQLSNNLKIHFSKDKSEQLRLASDMDILVGRRVSIEVLEAAVNLKHYIFPGTGVDGLLNTFSKYSRRNEIILSNTHRSSYNCAQQAVALLLACMNQLSIHDNRMRNQEPPTRDPTSILLQNMTVGLLGYGPINKYTHEFLKGFDVDFAILKRTWSNEDVQAEKFLPEKLAEFLDKIDVLIIGVPLTSETRGMIGSSELERLGSSSFLVNVARGAIVDQEALYNSLKNNVIKAAGLDVWYRIEEDGKTKYGYSQKYPFHELSNAILQPHRANSGGNITRWDPVFVNVKKYINGDSDYENVIHLELGY